MAVPVCVLTIVKAMTYRGVVGEEWSNTYALSGATPADSTAWKALFDAIVVQEKTCYHSGVSVTRGYGYDKIPQKGDHTVWTVDLRPSSTTVPGTLSLTSAVQTAGDQAGWIRWSLNRFNSHGKRIYLRKYFHGAGVATGGGDSMSATTKGNYDAFGAFMFGGTLLGSRTIVDKLGNVPIASASSQYVTTRTLKRRSKRNPT
jgi:hypothetical protein